ncbi:lysine-specific demethylase 7B [Copidosoma floridanum]|uniref:lysine-specific demethylase 7B n=1 Tax=Copidosoma floridanum TaxID=29053 RepID=UPI0006C9B8E7|nr:lysine-specific demethylase 7B [Copidosoma floridanum]
MEIPLKKCKCGDQMDRHEFSIQCKICNNLSHGRCTAMKEYLSTEIDEFHCPECCHKHGPSVMKKRINNHRHDYSETEADQKPVQTGTPVFIKELMSRHFSGANEIVRHIDGHLLTLSYLEANGFEIPIIVNNKESLDMALPPSSFSLYDIETYIGGDYEIDVIDVAKQNNVRMKLSEFVEYFYDPHRSRILNVISLEVTNTSLSTLIKAPHIARQLDWVNYVWPEDWPDNSELKRAKVQKYCLISVRDSFTDFHIDFGGTSVWYHVLRGEKIFYIIRPTQANLHLYQQWLCSSSQSETFFGDQVDACYKFILKEGQTMMIPTGWIHAVLTPVDSLVFGGNFIHSLNIPMQLQVYEMEKKMKTPAKFQYPSFETINWFAAKHLLKELKNLNHVESKCPSYLLHGLKALLSLLKQWNTDKDYNMFSRNQIPTTINSHKLVKDLTKEIRSADRLLNSINPPKPERESERRKKKLYNQCKQNSKVIDSMTNVNDKVKTKDSVEKSTNDSQLLTSVAANKQPEKRLLHQTSITENHSPQKTYDFKRLQDKIHFKNVSIRRNRIVCREESKIAHNRFKLDDKESVSSTQSNNECMDNFKVNHVLKTRSQLPWRQTTSVYDFHDGSNDSDNNKLTICKVPKTKSTKYYVSNKQEYLLCTDKFEDSINVRKNGIEELIEASAYASVPDTKLSVA